jgi:hypothetical protein
MRLPGQEAPGRVVRLLGGQIMSESCVFGSLKVVPLAAVLIPGSQMQAKVEGVPSACLNRPTIEIVMAAQGYASA